MLDVGAALPKLSANDESGTAVKLAGLDRPLVVYFFPRADTPGWTSESKQFGELYKKFRKKGAEVVGVSRDSVAAQRKFKDKYGLPFTLLADVDSKICDAFGVIVEKNMYGRKTKGIARSTFLVGKNGKIEKVWPKVKVEGHAAEVLASLA
jgi:thioredoxin-dependent peroxiredoxin